MRYARLADVPWGDWAPDQRATLLFVIDGRRVLLIRKKRGLGAGKISAPGGTIEDGESAAACARRELFEEVCLEAGDVEYAGEHAYQFTDGFGLYVAIYKTTEFSGAPAETEEATPLWFDLDAIPYDEMWADDRHWIPLMLAGKQFTGRWLFDGDDIVDFVLEAD